MKMKSGLMIDQGPPKLAGFFNWGKKSLRNLQNTVDNICSKQYTISSSRDATITKGAATMKKYIAIGHWYDSKNTVSTVACDISKANFIENLKGNGFKAYAVLTEKAFNEMKSLDCFELYDKVQKLTSNYRMWNVITDYIEQCTDIIEGKLEDASWN